MVVSAFRASGKVKDIIEILNSLDNRSFEYYKNSALNEAKALEVAKTEKGAK